MSDDSFAGLVAEEVKNKVTPSQRKFLELPENRSRWRRALEILSKNLDEQIRTHDRLAREEYERYEAMGTDAAALLAQFEIESSSKRKRISRFKHFVDERLVGVIRQIEIEQGKDTPSEREGIVEFLTQAIDKHRDLMIAGDYDYTQIDQALWAALEGRWDFDNIDPDQLGPMYE